jgi:osmotically-inducible protein OsmY
MKSKLSSSLPLCGLAAALLAGALAGCAPLIVGGAAVGTALMVSDRRTSGAQIDDEAIELRAAARLRETFGDRVHVNVTSYNRQVLLTGEVPNENMRQQAEQIVRNVENVRTVVNELAVGPASSLTGRSNDVLITGKVRASFVDANDLQTSAFKVVTERGAVYLMGRVTQREADRATSIARQISGVQKVVRVFEIVTPQELASGTGPAAPLQPATVAPAPAPAPAPVTEPQPSGAVVTPVR